MADEPGSVPEKQPESAVERHQADAAPAAPAVDHEKEQIRAELAQHKQAMDELRGLVSSGRVKILDSPEQKPQEPEDESALVDRKELKKHFEDLKRTVAGAFVETTSQSARQMRSTQVELLRGKLKDYDKYEGEVNALLDKMDPRIAANPDTIIQVHKVVRSQHLEEIEAEAEARAAARYRESQGEDFEEPELDEPGALAPPMSKPAGTRTSSSPVARSGGVAPSGDASASRPVLRGTPAVKPLSRDEKTIAGWFGIKDAEEFRRMADPSWKPDTTGFKGKLRI